ncbi:MAG: OsmC family protein [Hydrogenophaga sp.]|uniref:OsmC family protein n=1 Tax=Hydrogenophaga sp. TaxID=1904254 RepID=UPI001DB07E83|nr:OsmC family protein [Hydrogenophaga sp.]MBX3608705.1 OsmC family protein [Hydrogenophaga sp.]
MNPLAPRDQQIQCNQNQFIRELRADPGLAVVTTRTQGRVEDGLTCHIRQGRFEVVSDLGRRMGGDGAGPSPSFYARAGIVGCVAIGIKMAAARSGLGFRSVHVSVETDMDDGALLGVGDRSAAPLATRITIAIDTDADAPAVDALVQRVLAMDPWYLALRDAQCVTTRVDTVVPESV